MFGEIGQRSRQYYQVGSVIGGVSTNCGDRDYPGIYSRIDNPEILNFILTNAFQKPLGNLNFYRSSEKKKEQPKKEMAITH